jgi:hypothetical protein
MAFNINEMRAGLALGGARPTLFRVELTNPVNNAADSITPFLIRATSLPNSTINPIEIPYFGRKIKIAGDRTFDAWSVTVMNDEDFRIRHTMEQWHNQINSLQTNLNLNADSSPSNYKSTALVTQYGKSGEELRRYKFNGLFPTEISTIDLDWDTTDQIENFTVTFAYDWYEIDGGNTGLIG